MNFEYIIQTLWVAPKGTTHLVYEYKDQLGERFPSWLIKETTDKITIAIENQSALLSKLNERTFCPLKEQGFYDFLWHLGEETSKGFTIEASSIPFLQTGIEICEFLGLDIFEQSMEGSVFIITNNPMPVLELLQSYHVPSAIIGRLNDTKARIISDGDRQTYITPPIRRKTDKHYKVVLTDIRKD